MTEFTNIRGLIIISTLQMYIENLKEYIKQNPELSEEEIIRYVYLDLGKKFSFDIEFIPFGNGKKRQEIYNQSINETEINDCMEKWVGICKTMSYAMEYILRNVGIEIITIKDLEDRRRNCPHVYNIIYPKEKNRKPYIIDLQDDVYNIQSHSFTPNFGKSLEDNEPPVISRLEQEQMDRKLGYIDDENYYADDYLYLLKYDMGFIEDFGERVRFVLENIDIHDNPDMGYIDRQWHHVSILEALFPPKDFDYGNDGRIRMVNCYKEVNNIKHCINCIAVLTKRGTEIYVYNKQEYRYKPLEFKYFIQAVQNGLVIHNCKVPGLKNALRQAKMDDEQLGK